MLRNHVALILYRSSATSWRREPFHFRSLLREQVELRRTAHSQRDDSPPALISAAKRWFAKGNKSSTSSKYGEDEEDLRRKVGGPGNFERIRSLMYLVSDLWSVFCWSVLSFERSLNGRLAIPAKIGTRSLSLTVFTYTRALSASPHTNTAVFYAPLSSILTVTATGS